MKKYYALETEEDEADITIFGDITSWPWMTSDVSAYMLSKQIAELDVDTINVHISSYGGEVMEGLAIYNSLKQHKAKIRTYCDGFACSIASVIFMAGRERIISNVSLLMAHNAWTNIEGNAQELRKAADDLDKITQASINAYMEHVNISEAEIKKLLDNETWLTPQEALDLGFATAISGVQVQEKYSQSVRKGVFQMLTGIREGTLITPHAPEKKPEKHGSLMNLFRGMSPERR